MSNEKVLWYQKPALTWLQGMPIGNGRLGAMVKGKLREEAISINEESIWAVGPVDRNNKDAFAYLSEIRTLLFANEVERAQSLAEMAMVGTHKKQAPYQQLGEINLLFANHCDDSMEEFRQGEQLSEAQQVWQKRLANYHRQLDLETATASVSYDMDGVGYTREFFASAPDNVLVGRLASAKKGALSVGITLYRRLDGKVCIEGTNQIKMSGQSGIGGTQYCTVLSVVHKGGTMRSVGTTLWVENADEIELRLVAQTDYRSPDFTQEALKKSEEVQKTSYETLKARHIADYQRLFQRVAFALPEQGDHQNLPTAERVQRVKQGETDLGLITLYFHFGRYLLISSSRPGSLPANLQGLWCDSLLPSWDSKYTININTQMNYWGAESCNLSECHMPLFAMLDAMRPNGRITAEKMYHCRGFVAHHNTDIWNDTAPLDHTRAGVWAMGAAWLCYHLWAHYEYGQDKAFLAQTAYPIMAEAATFLLDYLQEDANGVLQSGPSISPENKYLTKGGQIGWLCMSPAMDIQIIRGLFVRVQNAANILGIEDAFTANIAQSIAKLPPMKIGARGQLQEWQEDYAEIDPGHRHISHLFSVYPDNHNNAEENPELFTAAQKSLALRQENGGGSTGWSQAWLIALLARFGRGEDAHHAIEKLLRELTEESLLDMHPPRIFQIDGNLGTIAGIAELFLQCRYDKIILFPALPTSWRHGHMNGLCAVGGLTVSFVWEEDGTAQVTLHAKQAVHKKICLKTFDHVLEEDCVLAAGEEKVLHVTLF